MKSGPSFIRPVHGTKGKGLLLDHKVISKESTMGKGGFGISSARSLNRKTTETSRKLQVSPAFRKWSMPMKLVLSGNGIKQRSNCH